MSLTIRLVTSEPCTACNRPTEPVVVYSDAITHNVSEMAAAIEIRGALWDPTESGIETAAQLHPHLRVGLVRLERAKAALLLLEASNGWGTHAGFTAFVERMLQACKDFPFARVEVSK